MDVIGLAWSTARASLKVDDSLVLPGLDHATVWRDTKGRYVILAEPGNHSEANVEHWREADFEVAQSTGSLRTPDSMTYFLTPKDNPAGIHCLANLVNSDPLFNKKSLNVDGMKPYETAMDNESENESCQASM